MRHAWILEIRLYATAYSNKWLNIASDRILLLQLILNIKKIIKAEFILKYKNALYVLCVVHLE